MESMEFILFRIALVVYIISWILLTASLVFKKKALAASGLILVTGGLVLNVTSITMRGLSAQHMPFTNLYETLSLFSILLVLAFLFARRWIRVEITGPFVIPLVLLAMIIGLINYVEAGTLAPALRSFWLSVHVPIAILSYALFAMAFIGGLLYVMKEKTGVFVSVLSRLPALELIDVFIYRVITAGFILLTVAIMTGAIWAEIAWGSYWSWDPKETWSLVTWIVYALYLHARLLRGWQGMRSAILAMVGFGAVLFTYFGVTYLFSGFHSYA